MKQMSFIFLSKHKKKYAVPFSALSSFLAIKEHQERFSLAASYFRSFFFLSSHLSFMFVSIMSCCVLHCLFSLKQKKKTSTQKYNLISLFTLSLCLWLENDRIFPFSFLLSRNWLRFDVVSLSFALIIFCMLLYGKASHWDFSFLLIQLV